MTHWHCFKPGEKRMLLSIGYNMAVRTEAPPSNCHALATWFASRNEMNKQASEAIIKSCQDDNRFIGHELMGRYRPASYVRADRPMIRAGRPMSDCFEVSEAQRQMCRC